MLERQCTCLLKVMHPLRIIGLVICVSAPPAVSTLVVTLYHLVGSLGKVRFPVCLHKQSGTSDAQIKKRFEIQPASDFISRRFENLCCFWLPIWPFPSVFLWKSMGFHEARKRNPNLNFLVRIFSGGVGFFHVKGWGAKSSVCPSKPGKSNFFGGISRDFAGISRRCPKSLRKTSLCSIFVPYKFSEIYKGNKKLVNV